MSQNDMTIANQGFPATRSDINSALQALASTSSGATEPSTMFANQLWFDTAANKLKIRNEANSAWYDIVEINESTGALSVSFGAGTAALPAITTTGDTNTGIFFPAADTIAFTEGGAEAMRINSSGNVGIGATPGTILDVYKASGNPYLRVYTGTGSVQAYVQAIDSTYVVMGSLSNHDLGLVTNGTEVARLTTAGLFKFNSGYGSVATAYGCRAWVNFNGGGSPITVAAGGNVSSITDGGVGTYTVNLTTAMPDTNYSAVATAQSGANGTILRTATFSTSSFIVYTSYVNFPGSNMPSLDCIVCVAVFR